MRERVELALGALALAVACGGNGGSDPVHVGTSQGGTGGAAPSTSNAGAGVAGSARGGTTSVSGVGGDQNAGAATSGQGGTAAVGGSATISGGASTGGASSANTSGTTGSVSAGGRVAMSSGGSSASMGGRVAMSSGGSSASMGGSAGRNGSNGGSASGGTSSGGAGNSGGVTLPPANGSFDYQIGGAYPPPTGVKVVSRDRGDSPAPGLYNICYVNGFQAQQADDDWWLSQHADLVLRDNQGKPVIDPDWNEMLLDTSIAQKRQDLADVVGGWIKGCAADGFDAVEIDNLDSFSRSGGRLSQANNVAFMKLLSDTGHQAGLAMGQKNSTELLSSRSAMGTDFAVAEECNRYSECGDYTQIYGDLVFVIEYREQDFKAGCQNFPQLSIVHRDVNVSTPGSSAYVYEGC